MLVTVLWLEMGKALGFGKRDGWGTELLFFPFLFCINNVNVIIFLLPECVSILVSFF